MTQETETMTHGEALLWLAALAMTCPDCVTYQPDEYCGSCGGHRKVPVLDLREPCQERHLYYTFNEYSSGVRPAVGCWEVRCCGWRPKQGAPALHAAMHKDGWNRETSWLANGMQHCSFWKWLDDNLMLGKDSDDHVAAAKAMYEAGYQ